MSNPHVFVDPRKLARKEALMARLRGVYDGLQQLQVAHNRTAFTCQRSGGCCQVGLTVHLMECENLARALRAKFADDPEGLAAAVDRLKLAFTDPDWTPNEITGMLMCSMWDGEGCGIYLDRPAVCRMYGVILTVDDFCPRTRLTSGEPVLFANAEVDKLMRGFYRTVDTYGRLFPHLDYSVFMPAGVLSFLLPDDELAELKANTPARFWRRTRGYRTQFRFSKQLAREMAPADWRENQRIGTQALRESPFRMLPPGAARK